MKKARNREKPGCPPDDPGERLNGIQEVEGSIPFVSTRKRLVQSKDCTSLLYKKKKSENGYPKEERKRTKERKREKQGSF